MRFSTWSCSVLVALVVLSTTGWTLGQCEGYPADKTYRADDSTNLLLIDANGSYPGWPVETGGAPDHGVERGTLGGKACQIDWAGFGAKRKYRSDDQADPSWTIQGGQPISLIWHVYIDSYLGSAGIWPTTRMPAVKIRNGRNLVRLDFYADIFGTGNGGCAPDGGPYSGWRISEGGTDTLPVFDVAGGNIILNNDHEQVRYLPMTTGQWHTIRLDLYPDPPDPLYPNGTATFHAWIDPELGITSSRRHLTARVTATTGSKYAQIGHTESDGTEKSSSFGTACAAWAEGTPGVDFPAAPTVPVDCDVDPGNSACGYPEDTLEACRNGIDDDSDTAIDCDDSDCAAYAHCAEDAPEFVITSIRQMGRGESPQETDPRYVQNMVFFSVYDENGNTLPDVVIRDPKSCYAEAQPHSDNGQAGHYRITDLEDDALPTPQERALDLRPIDLLEGQKSYRFYVYSDNGGPVRSEITPELFQAVVDGQTVDRGWGWMIEFMRKSNGTNPGGFTPLQQVFDFDDVLFNEFDVQPNLTLVNDANSLGPNGYAEWIQTFKVPPGVTRVLSARIGVQVGGGVSYQYRVTVHEILGNNPPQTPADLGPQIGAAKLSPMIRDDGACWNDAIVVWPANTLDAVVVQPGGHYALRVVRADQQGDINLLRTTDNWTTDIVVDQDRIEALYLDPDSGGYVLEAGFFDARAYIVGGSEYPPCIRPVFDLSSQETFGVRDGKVNGYDFVLFQECATGPGAAPSSFESLSAQCKCLDINGDQSVDQVDFAGFQLCYSGEELADPNCHP